MQVMRQHSVAVLIVLALMLAPSVMGDTVSSTLGSAGPSDYAILFLSTSGQPQMNGPGTTNGNVGYNGSSTLQLNGSSGHQEVNGNLLLGNFASVNDTTQVTGTILTGQSAILNAAQTAAVNAAATFSSFAPTIAVAPVTGNLTINGNAGLNVVNLTGINLGNGQVLTLNAPAGAQFVINDSGDIVLNSAMIVETGGISTNDVVFNVTGKVQTSGGLNNESIINGVVLDLTGQIGMAPGEINGELIAGGNNPQIVSGGSVNSVMSAPEPGTIALLGFGLLSLFMLGSRRKVMLQF